MTRAGSSMGAGTGDLGCWVGMSWAREQEGLVT